MKKLIVFYSLDGNTRLIAESMAQSMGADLLELKLERPFKFKGFFKFFFGGMAAKRKQTPNLMPLEKQPEAYDLLVLGTPIWAGIFAPAMRTFLSQHPLKGKKIAFFCCHGGGGAGRSFEEMRQILKDNELLGELALVAPLQKEREQKIQIAQEWAKNLA